MISPHELRHNGGSIAYMNGTDIMVISERMGHSSVNLTREVYIHLNRDHHRAAAEQIAASLGTGDDENMIRAPTPIRKQA